jgi:hypothetical protein
VVMFGRRRRHIAPHVFFRLRKELYRCTLCRKLEPKLETVRSPACAARNKQTNRQTDTGQTDRQTNGQNKKKEETLKVSFFSCFGLVWFVCVLCFMLLLVLFVALAEVLTQGTHTIDAPSEKKKNPLVFLLVFFLIKKRLTKCGGGCLFFTMEFRVEKEFALVFTVRTSREAGLF